MKGLTKPADVLGGCAVGVAGVRGHDCVCRGQGAAECFSCQLILEGADTRLWVKRHDFAIAQVSVTGVVDMQARSIWHLESPVDDFPELPWWHWRLFEGTRGKESGMIGC